MAYELIINSDFDAVVSAHLLMKEYKIDSIRFVEPGEVNEKKVSVNRAKTIVANLPYVDGAEIWFDHHHSNVSEHSHVEGLREIQPSCVRVIANYFNLDETELIRQSDIIDSADFSRDDIFNPQGYQLFSHTINGATSNSIDMDYNRMIIPIVDDLEKLMSLPEVLKRIEKFQSSFDMAKIYISDHSHCEKNVLIVDLRDASSMELLSSSYKFIHYSIYEQANISIRMYHPDLNKDLIRFQVGHSIFNKSSSVNVAEVLKPLGGGGHAYAGGITIPSDSFDEVFKTIKEALIEQ